MTTTQVESAPLNYENIESNALPIMPKNTTTNSVQVHYDTFEAFPGWDGARQYLLEYIKKNNIKKILEIGSGANPTLTEYDVLENSLEYTTNDIDSSELLKVSAEFSTLQMDFTSSEMPEDILSKYDLVFSRMVNEHVRSGKQYYNNLYKVLKPGGKTIHFFSTLYSFPFVVNRIMPEFISDFLLEIFTPRSDSHMHGKFKAYYSWSRGPSKRSIKRLESLGFDVISYVGYFGHSYYLKRLPLLHKIEMTKARLMKNHLKISSLTSYAAVELSKPEY